MRSRRLSFGVCALLTTVLFPTTQTTILFTTQARDVHMGLGAPQACWPFQSADREEGGLEHLG
jgi:hypothetical protein